MNQAQGFDIDLLDNDTINQAIHQVPVIFNEMGDPVSGFVIVGKNSDQYRQVQEDIRIENIKRAARRQVKVDTSTDEGAAVVVKTMDDNERRTALAITVGWFGMNKGGQPMIFDKAVVEKMYNKFPQWQERVLADLEKDANFMKG
jgi:hypothetical protein